MGDVDTDVYFYKFFYGRLIQVVNFETLIKGSVSV